jgi:UDP-glucuronate decarboxylase
VNIGNPIEFTMLELAEQVLDLTGSTAGLIHAPLLHSDDPRQRQPDISIARQRLRWEPQVALREGLMATIPYFETELGLSVSQHAHAAGGSPNA